MAYLVPQDLRAKPQILKGIDVIDFLIVVGVGVTGYVLAESIHMVAPVLRIPFMIFNVLVAIYLVLPSPWNKGKKNWQSMQYALTCDKYTYHLPDSGARPEVLDRDFIDEQLTRAEVITNWEKERSS